MIILYLNLRFMKNFDSEKIILIALTIILWSCAHQKSQPEPPKEESISVLKSTFEHNGVTYQTIEIDSIIWLAQNMNIPSEDGWCYDRKEENCLNEGKLYRWEAAIQVCKSLGKDWSLPSDQDWKKLTQKFGGYREWIDEKDYGNPKMANIALVTGGSSSFDAILNGWRGSTGGFDSKGKAGFYWSSTEQNEDKSICYIFYSSHGKVTRRSASKSMGMACRCIKKPG